MAILNSLAQIPEFLKVKRLVQSEWLFQSEAESGLKLNRVKKLLGGLECQQ